MKKMRIFLIGPMASGKTTIGEKLSKRLGLGFIDTDNEIEKNAGVEISWIFDIEGEESFRKREETALLKSVEKENLVISTGGGIVLSSKNRELISNSGLVVYLETSIQSQLERTINDKSRPLLNSKNKEKTLKDISKIRNPLYLEIADITIKAKERSHNKVIEEILTGIDSKELN